MDPDFTERPRTRSGVATSSSVGSNDGESPQHPPSSTTSDRPSTRRGSDERPGSRRGAMDRPMSRRGRGDTASHPQIDMVSERPVTQQGWSGRPQTGRPPTGGIGAMGGSAAMMTPMTPGGPAPMHAPSTALRNAPGTASRLASAMVQRPMSRLGTGVGLTAQVNVVERPITQQGLSGMKTGVKGPQRQVFDKSYFMGLLRTKISDLNSETARLETDMERLGREQSTFLTYDQRVKELASELGSLQGELGDFNLLVDKLNTDTEKAEVEEEVAEAVGRNQIQAREVEAAFARRQEAEAEIKRVDQELARERERAQGVMEDMAPEVREKFCELRERGKMQQEEMERLRAELDQLQDRERALEEEVSMSASKREAATLYERLEELEEKRDALMEEERSRGSPEEEKARLLAQVKTDTGEVGILERQTKEMADRKKRLKEEVSQLEKDLEEVQSERNQKYRELRRREESMEEFLTSFHDSRAKELARLAEVEREIVETLHKMGRSLAHFGQMPSVSDFSTLKEDLTLKEGELRKSRMTVEGLAEEQKQLQANLGKVEALEDKIRKEMVSLKEKMKTMDGEMGPGGCLSDMDQVRAKAEEKRQALAQQREKLHRAREMLLHSVQDLQVKHDNLKRQLSENDTYVQLVNLEKKWALLEKNNFVTDEFIQAKRAETDYEPLQKAAMQIVAEHNKSLIKALQQSGGVI